MAKPPSITDAHAKAAEAAALALREGIQAVSGLGGYLAQVFGSVPEDLVGYFGGDRLKIARVQNIVRIMQQAKALNDARGTEPEQVSISVGLPLLIAAADESRDELVDLWARLLAAAADPSRSKRFRSSFIEIVKKMDPIDAAVLRVMDRYKDGLRNIQTHQDWENRIMKELMISRDEMVASVFNLKKLDLVQPPAMFGLGELSALGREFLRAVGEDLDR